jgi:hypothetical protein
MRTTQRKTNTKYNLKVVRLTFLVSEKGILDAESLSDFYPRDEGGLVEVKVHQRFRSPFSVFWIL